MLSGSAMIRVGVLLVTAALLAGLVQYLWPRTAPEPTVVRAPQTSGAPPAPEPLPAPLPAPEPAPPAPRAAPQPPPVNPAPPPVVAAPPEPAPQPASRAAAPPAPGFVLPALDAAETAQDTAGPRAVALVDLNTGTLAQLNGLRGGGNIGRAIIQRRPYSSVDQLLSKRVLSRTTYDRIKDQVTVQ